MSATVPVEPQHGQWCIGGSRRVKFGSQARHCACLADCCARIRRNGQYQCVCTSCDGTCGAHLPDGASVTP